MRKLTRADYDMFSWLPLKNWRIDTIMGPMNHNRIFCKICDEYVIMTEAQKHVDEHVAIRKRQLAADRRKAKAERLEKLRLAREEKKRLKEGEISHSQKK